MTSVCVSRSAKSRRMRSRSSTARRSSSRFAWPRTMRWRASAGPELVGEPGLDEPRRERVELALHLGPARLDLAP